ncbi:MAG: hypothetical protein IJV44_05145 [Prevotella sp.]|nr:hypothetical protein [Bacteroidaceae bacterium]MBQ9677506.1 hypothetical protein [Prevotella sp.]
MATIAKASEHIKPCNIAQCERHNRRDAEYIKSLDPTRLYIRLDLTHNNECYVAPGMEGVTLQQHYDHLKVLVKEKTGRAMQEKDVEYKDKKGVTRVRKGSSPIREGVVNIKPDTTMDDLLQYVNRVHERWGITAIQIHMHRDEGHYENPEDESTWQPNLHAHIIWDWIDHTTGKSFKLNAEDMSAIQDMVAETLEMERGKRKSETGRDHLERNDYIIQAQKEKSAKLDAEIAEKRDRLDAENGNAIKSGVANLFGRGKYADMERENKLLKEKLTKQKADLQQKYQQALDVAQTRKAQQLAEKDKQIEELQTKLKREVFSHQQDNQEKDRIIRQKESIINDYRERLGHYLNTLSELLRGAVKAVIDYVQLGYRCFNNRQEGDVRRYMNSQPDKEEAANMVLCASQPFLKADESERVKGQLTNILKNMKEGHLQSRSHGFHM